MRGAMIALVLMMAALHNCAGIAAETKASFYSKPQRQACRGVGRFNPDALTAAHRTLPCGTRIEVTNRMNGRSVVVVITDRGPNARTGRGLDLSRAAADVIGMRRAGVAPVTYRIISPAWVHARRFEGCWDDC